MTQPERPLSDASPVIERSLGDWRLAVAPDLGGAVARLTWRGRDVLRPLPTGARDVLAAGCFPLTPYANRIALGRFDWRGRKVQLPVLPQFAPHALHGDGWRSAWRDESASDAGGAAGSIILSHRSDDSGWPWPYEARQTFELSDDGLRIGLAVTNIGDEDMPAGLGLHPYFPITPQTRLELDAPSVWVGEPGAIPQAVRRAADVYDWADGPTVMGAPFVDHCYVGWSGSARLIEPDRIVTITASPNARWAHVFAPPGQDFCCVEPVTHRPDAINAPADEDSGLAVLAAGQTVSMSLSVSAAAV